MVKRIICILTAAMLLFCTMALSEECDGLRSLKVGDTGEDVLLFKQVLAALGYMNSVKFSAGYTKETAEKVKLFQLKNGLPPTGEADTETQRLAYRMAGMTPPPAATPTPVPPVVTPAPTATPSPTATPMPVIGADGYPADMPTRGEEGFPVWLGQADYRFCSEELGLWFYISPTLMIEIRRYEDAPGKNIWFECDIQASPESPLLSRINWSKDGRITVAHEPVRCALENGYVLCLSDDHFGARLHAGSKLGVCIRDGEIITNEAFTKPTKHFPNLDVLALFKDGSMRAYLNGEHTAAEYLAMGAVDTFSFGPLLVRDGQINPLVYDRDYHYVKEPRCALGVIGPYHYFALVVNGRTGSAKGVKLDWLAEKMLEKGVTDAINLDGGGTASLVFLGERLNKTGSSVRSLYSCIGFGSVDLSAQP